MTTSRSAAPRTAPTPPPKPGAPAQIQPPRTPRLTLASVVKGKQAAPYRIVGYGTEGIGKSTFAADAPNPIFLPTEDGTFHLDVARFPKPTSFEDVLDAVQELTNAQHDFKTFVIDTLDHLEHLVWAETIRRTNARVSGTKQRAASSIEEVGGGFGKGYDEALTEWRRLLAAIERLQATKGMHVIQLAHAHVKNFKNPLDDDYERYQLKLNQKAAGLMKEWAHELLFMRHEDLAAKDEKARRVRGVSTGARIIHTEHSAAWDAKNRHSLPPELPLSWVDFDEACQAHQTADPQVLVEEITRKAKEAEAFDAAFAKAILDTIPKMNGDAERLANLNNRVNVRLAALTAERPEAQKEQVQ